MCSDSLFVPSISKRRAEVVLSAALALTGCTAFPYEYVELTSENVEVIEVARPPRVGYFRLGVGRLPIRYALKECGVSLTLAVGDSWSANLDILSSVPIRDVSIENAYAFRRSPFEYSLTFGVTGASRAGEPVRIRIDLEDRSAPIVISGAIAESGKFYDCACIL